MTPHDLETAIGTLPDKLSDLLEVALDDFEKVTKRKDVVINMGEWCVPYSGRCHVCLAGSIFASRIGVENIIAYDNDPSELVTPEVSMKLCALNALRLGAISEACDYLEIQLPDGAPVEFLIQHSQGSTGFIPEMRSLIHLLRTHEL